MTLQAVAAVFGLLLAPITGENLRTLTGGQTPRDQPARSPTWFFCGQIHRLSARFSFPLTKRLLEIPANFLRLLYTQRK